MQQRNMTVVKFGGTSLADAKKFIEVAKLIVERSGQIKTLSEQPHDCCSNLAQVAAVLSAPSGITNALVSLVENAVNRGDCAQEIAQIEHKFSAILAGLTQLEPRFVASDVQVEIDAVVAQLKAYVQGILLLGLCPDKIYARIISKGERLSIAIMSQLLTAQGYTTFVIDPVKYLVATGPSLEAAVDIEASTARFRAAPLPVGAIGLMPGFTAGNEQQELVTLGRNGSDYSAAVLAACLRADCCEIWTDVDGVYSCDPRVVPDAKLLKSLSYKEAMELSYFGAKVLHPKTIAPIARFHIPCLIKNTNNPKAAGTLISQASKDENFLVKGITTLDKLSMVNLSGPGMKGMVGMAARVFTAMSQAKVSVVLITQSSSEYSISFCIQAEDKHKALAAVHENFELEIKNGLLDPVEFVDDISIVSLVGDAMRTVKGIASTFFASLAQVNVNIVAIAQGSSERSISAVIPSDKVTEAVKACHENLFNAHHYLDVFIVGTGGVGAELIEQIHRQQLNLAAQGIMLRVCGLANSQRMWVDCDGIDLSNWQGLLSDAPDAFNLAKLVRVVQQHHIINPVLVDCTASDEIASQYANFLTCGFHVVTPNKRANTDSMEYYRLLRQTARASRRKLLYETTVGAGLPVIENLQNLLAAGDKLHKFSGILSGSLSYIFGQLEEGKSFSQAVKTAKANGFTEPDPRDDLFGTDVARKLLILAREAGFELELSDVVIEPALAPDCDITGDSEQFLAKLDQQDEYFAAQVRAAQQQGKVLRYIGTIDNGQCKVAIKAVDPDDPMFKIKEGENALAFYSQYYQPLPLILRGYGAGSAVTAAGIFADIMRTLGWKLGS